MLNNPLNFTDSQGKNAVLIATIPIISAGYVIGTIFVFKDCMERCTGTKLPRGPQCDRPDPKRFARCAKLCTTFAITLGFGSDPIGSLASGVGGAVGESISDTGGNF